MLRGGAYNKSHTIRANILSTEAYTMNKKGAQSPYNLQNRDLQRTQKKPEFCKQSPWYT